MLQVVRYLAREFARAQLLFHVRHTEFLYFLLTGNNDTHHVAGGKFDTCLAGVTVVHVQVILHAQAGMYPHPFSSFFRQHRLGVTHVSIRQRDPREREFISHPGVPRLARQLGTVAVAIRRCTFIFLRYQGYGAAPVIVSETESDPHQVTRQEIHTTFLTDHHFQVKIYRVTTYLQEVARHTISATRERGFHVVEIHLPFHQLRVLSPVLETRNIHVRASLPRAQAVELPIPVAVGKVFRAAENVGLRHRVVRVHVLSLQGVQPLALSLLEHQIACLLHPLVESDRASLHHVLHAELVRQFRQQVAARRVVESQRLHFCFHDLHFALPVQRFRPTGIKIRTVDVRQQQIHEVLQRARQRETTFTRQPLHVNLVEQVIHRAFQHHVVTVFHRRRFHQIRFPVDSVLHAFYPSVVSHPQVEHLARRHVQRHLVGCHDAPFQRGVVVGKTRHERFRTLYFSKYIYHILPVLN